MKENIFKYKDHDNVPLNPAVVYGIKSTGSLYQRKTAMPHNEAVCIFT